MMPTRNEIKEIWYQLEVKLKRIIPVISGTAGGRKFRKKKRYIEPIEMKRLWFDVTQLSEELLHAFDWLPNQPN